MERYLFAATTGNVRPTDAVDMYWKDKYDKHCPYRNQPKGTKEYNALATQHLVQFDNKKSRFGVTTFNSSKPGSTVSNKGSRVSKGSSTYVQHESTGSPSKANGVVKGDYCIENEYKHILDVEKAPVIATNDDNNLLQKRVYNLYGIPMNHEDFKEQMSSGRIQQELEKTTNAQRRVEKDARTRNSATETKRPKSVASKLKGKLLSNIPEWMGGSGTGGYHPHRVFPSTDGEKASKSAPRHGYYAAGSTPSQRSVRFAEENKEDEQASFGAHASERGAKGTSDYYDVTSATARDLARVPPQAASRGGGRGSGALYDREGASRQAKQVGRAQQEHQLHEYGSQEREIEQLMLEEGNQKPPCGVDTIMKYYEETPNYRGKKLATKVSGNREEFVGFKTKADYGHKTLRAGTGSEVSSRPTSARRPPSAGSKPNINAGPVFGGGGSGRKTQWPHHRPSSASPGGGDRSYVNPRAPERVAAAAAASEPGRPKSAVSHGKFIRQYCSSRVNPDLKPYRRPTNSEGGKFVQTILSTEERLKALEAEQADQKAEFQRLLAAHPEGKGSMAEELVPKPKPTPKLIVQVDDQEEVNGEAGVSSGMPSPMLMEQQLLERETNIVQSVVASPTKPGGSGDGGAPHSPLSPASTGVKCFAVPVADSVSPLMGRGNGGGDVAEVDAVPALRPNPFGGPPGGPMGRPNPFGGPPGGPMGRPNPFGGPPGGGGGGGFLAMLQAGKSSLKKAPVEVKTASEEVKLSEEEEHQLEARRTHYKAFLTAVGRLYVPVVTIDDFNDERKLLGRGKFAAVYSATCRESSTFRRLTSESQCRHQHRGEHMLVHQESDHLGSVERDILFAIKLAQYAVFKGHSPSRNGRQSPEASASSPFAKFVNEHKAINDVAISRGTYSLPPLAIVDEYQREIESMTMLKGHANILHLLGIITPEDPSKTSRPGSPAGGGSTAGIARDMINDYSFRLGLVLEYMDIGNLGVVLEDKDWQENNGVSERLHIAQGVAAGLTHMHKHRYVHRDIKVHNIMLKVGAANPATGRPTVIAKVADFGTAVHLQEGDMLNNMVGTMGYIAPEAYAPGEYGLPVDMFAYAVVVWATFSQTRVNPMADVKFGDASNKKVPSEGQEGVDEEDSSIEGEEKQDCDIYAAAALSEQNMRPEFGPEHPVLVSELVEGCWIANPALRPCASTVAGLLTKLLAEPARLMHVYDIRYAHFLHLNRSFEHEDFDPGLYIQDPQYYHDETTAPASRRNKTEYAAALSEHGVRRSSDHGLLETSEDIVCQNDADLVDKLVAPRSMISLVKNEGDSLLRSVRESVAEEGSGSRIAQVARSVASSQRRLDMLSEAEGSSSSSTDDYDASRVTSSRVSFSLGGPDNGSSSNLLVAARSGSATAFVKKVFTIALSRGNSTVHPE